MLESWCGIDVQGFAEHLAVGLWLAMTGGAWIVGLRGIISALRGVRPLVESLRWGTWACIVQFLGLAAILLVDNPERWKTLPWFLSLTPLGLALLGVLVASCRGTPEPRGALEPGE